MRRLIVWSALLLGGSLAGVRPAQATLLFNTNAAFTFFKGTTEASTPDTAAWRQPAFNAAAWLVANGPFFYGEPLTGTLLSDMQGGYTTLYLRRTFVLNDLTGLSALQLEMLTDDGHIVWINGVEIGRFNVAAGQRPNTATASSALEPTAHTYTVTDLGMLRLGTNVVAIQGFNASLSGSSDFVLSCALATLTPDTVAPTVAGQSPSAGVVGSLAQLTVEFSEPVVGVDVWDLLINGSPATGMSGADSAYTFTFPQPAYGLVNVTWANEHGIQDFGLPPNAFAATGPGATWQYTLVDNTPPAAASILPLPNVTVRSLTQIQVDFSEPVAGVDAADLRMGGVQATNVVPLAPASYLFQFAPPPTGSVAVAWVTDHGIHDLASPANAFAGGSWTYLLDPNAVTDAVRLNELVTANLNGLRDEDNETHDWVELHNLGNTTISLAGWSLTDDAGDPEKWIFPNVALGPRGFLVVFCSGKDRQPTTPGSRLHTNFKLDPDGEFLGLYNAEVPRQAVSVFARYPNQRVDYSYGYDAAGQLRYFATPTPGTANGSSSLVGVVGELQFSHARGFYSNTLALVLSTATTNATIRYTLNGTAPTATTGSVYAGPLTVNGTTVIRAAAFYANYLPSEIECHTYLFLKDVIRQSANGAAPPGWPASWGANAVDYGMDPDIVNSATYSNTIAGDLLAIPSFSIVMNLDDLFGGSGIYANPGGDGLPWERPASLELIYPEATPGFQINGGLRIRGGFSRNTQNPKHAFRFFFRQDYGKAKLNFPVFGPGGAASFDKFDLRTMQNYSWAFQGDSRMICLRDVLARDQQLAMSGTGERGDFYHLYINGQYWGLYNSAERPEAAYGESYYGGRAEDYDTVKPDPDIGYTIEATDGTLEAWRRLWRAATNGFASDVDYFRVQGLNVDGTPNPAYENLVEVTNLVDYMLVILYGGNLDAPISNFLGNDSPNNFYAVRNRTGRFGGFRFFAHDSEHTLLNVNEDRTGPYAAGDPTQGSDVLRSNPQYVWQRLQANAEFRMLVADRVQRHCFNGGALSVEGARALFNTRSNEIDRAMVGESARWGDAKVATPFTRATWLSAMNSVAGFLNGRTTVLLNQLRADSLFPSVNAPSLSAASGAVPDGFALFLTNRTAGATIYYTLDGTDPRLRGGAVASAALAYAAGTPIIITLPTTIRARARSGSTWSPIVAATFYPPQSFADLRVTEIMYHPPALGSIPGEDLEFLELKNTGTNQLDLSGMYFDDGLQFHCAAGTRLAPGQFLVLGRNAARLRVKYPALTVAGTYSGKLNNAGERIRLLTPLGTPVLSVDYKDSGRWPITADGAGFSLVPEEASLHRNPDHPSHWRASTFPGGSPGADDPPRAIPRIVINEILTHTDPPALDAIELFNPTAVTADVGGWFLSDDPAAPRKFRIPDATTIPADGYVVFSEADFNPTPGTNNSFSLASAGEQVYLFAADAAGNLTGYTHGFNFGAAPNGVTLGRHLTSVEDERLVLQTAGTLGHANAGPLVGPVVFSHIMYHPPDLPDGSDNSLDEYVELRNLTASPVLLYDPTAPTNSWRVRGGVEFEFLANTVLGPNASLVLVNFAETNAAAVAAFRGKYGRLTATPLYGPYRGKLDNSSDTLRLQRPDRPDTNGVPYVTVDEVDYRDAAPWPPSADGSGAALQRLELSAYGDDPANWIGSTPLTILEVSPARVAVAAGTNAATATNVSWAVTAIGTGPLQYQWRKDGQALPGATNDTLTVSNVQLPDDGAYTVQVRDADSTVESTPVQLIVLVKPVIVQPPVDQTVAAGGWVTLSCAISGNPAPFTFEWRRGSLPLWTNVSSERSSLFTFQAGTSPGTTSYRVVVKNLAFPSPGVSHTPITAVTVLADADGDGLPDLWESAHGLDAGSPADASLDRDGDGISNADEYTAGTDPTDALSGLHLEGLTVGGPVALTFHAQSNKTYSVQYCDDLNAPVWSKLADVVAVSTNRLETVMDANPAAHRMYRLVTPGQP